MTVEALRKLLAELPGDLPVLRADIDWGGITVSQVQAGDFRQHTELGAGRVAYWEQGDFLPDEEDIIVRAVIIR
jgi:hypothetical protein